MADPPQILQPDVLLRVLGHELVPLVTTQRGVLRRVVHRSDGAGAREGSPQEREDGSAADLVLALALADDVAALLELLGGMAATSGRGHPGRPFAAVGSDLCRRHPGVRVHPSPVAGRCQVDAVRLGTVLDNLVRNEAEHAGALPRVDGVVRRRRLLVDVHHRGPVPVRMVAALRSRSAVPTPGDRGLGLWLVRCLVGQMGGSTDLARGEDGWSVRLTLPLRRGAVGTPGSGHEECGDTTEQQRGDARQRRDRERRPAVQDEQGQQGIAVLGHGVGQQAREVHRAVQVQPDPGDLEAAAG